MGPAMLLDKTNKMRKINMSPEVRSFILKRADFRDLVKKFDDYYLDMSDPFDAYNHVKRIYDEIDRWRGGCPKCNGRTVWRSGVYFENERRCVVCNHVWEP